MSNKNARASNCEVIEIKPTIFGGSPSDPNNKTIVTREQHFEYVRYWNKVIADLRRKKKSEM